MTTIEWTEETWNMIRARNKATGGVGHFCVHASEGCRKCYSEVSQTRWNNPVKFVAQDRSKVDIFLDETVLRKPLSWRRGREIFPCSMTDLFAEFHDWDWIDQTLAVAAMTPQHTYQCLTKRADVMRRYFNDPATPDRVLKHIAVIGPPYLRTNPKLTGNIPVWPLPNWQQGVSVEDQPNADERIPLLLDAKVAKRWISAEPLLAMITIRPYLEKDLRLGANRSPSLDWVVVGGESGPRARTFQVSWADYLISQCRHADVPIFVKQLGARPLAPDFEGVAVPLRLKDRKGGDPAEWPEALRVRERPT